MKKIIYILIFLVGFGVLSCDQSLTEIPKDFASPENSFTNKAGFDAALANIYLSIRTQTYVGKRR
jgi:starch-binding outer membrane protein, SusD/RagB family